MIKAKQQNSKAEDRLFNFRPILFIAVFLSLGIYFGYLYKVKGVSLWIMALPVFSFIFLLGFCWDRGRFTKRLIAVSSLLIAFFIGVIGIILQIDEYIETPYYEGEHTLSGVVCDYREGEYSTRLEIKEIYIEGVQQDGILIAYLPASYTGEIRLSDRLILQGELKTSVDVYKADVFRSQAILDDVRFEMQVEEVKLVGRAFNPFALVRERMKEVSYSGMDENYASVCFAVLTGNVSGIERGLLQNVRYGGIAHIFAVSGLHVGSLYAFCVLLINKTKCKNAPKTMRFIIVSLVLLLYGGVCGYSASVIRATIMCLVFYASKLIGYGSDNLERVGASALVVLLLSPVALFTVGFQLSYLACLGIMLLARPICNACMRLCAHLRLYAKERDVDSPPGVRERAVRHVASFLGVTLSAQIATLPVSYVWFGYISVWSLLLNCLYVPIVSMLFSWQLLFTLLACILPTVASTIIFFPLNGVWAVVLLAFEVVEFSPLKINGLIVTGGALICYYLTIVLFSDKLNLTKAEKWLGRSFGTISFLSCLLMASL